MIDGLLGAKSYPPNAIKSSRELADIISRVGNTIAIYAVNQPGTVDHLLVTPESKIELSKYTGTPMIQLF